MVLFLMCLLIFVPVVLSSVAANLSEGYMYFVFLQMLNTKTGLPWLILILSRVSWLDFFLSMTVLSLILVSSVTFLPFNFSALFTLVYVLVFLPFFALLILVRVNSVCAPPGLAFMLVLIDLSVFSVCFLLNMFLFFSIFNSLISLSSIVCLYPSLDPAMVKLFKTFSPYNYNPDLM